MLQPQLGLGCNLNKDQELSQLIKHKDIEQYLQLYIFINHEEYIIYSRENNEKGNKKASTTTYNTD